MFIVVFITGGNVFANLCLTGKIAADTVKHVYIRVIAIERPVNYDSLFQNQASKPVVKRPYITNKSEGKNNSPVNPGLAVKLASPKTVGGNFAKSRNNRNFNTAQPAQNAAEASANDTWTGSTSVKQNLIKNSQNPLARFEKVKENYRASKLSYIYTGILLLLAGIALGILFGRLAYLISVTGLVFLLIGLLIGK